MTVCHYQWHCVNVPLRLTRLSKYATESDVLYFFLISSIFKLQSIFKIQCKHLKAQLGERATPISAVLFFFQIIEIKKKKKTSLPVACLQSATDNGLFTKRH
jgi:hypothetical protein